MDDGKRKSAVILVIFKYYELLIGVDYKNSKALKSNERKPSDDSVNRVKCPMSLQDVDLFGPGAQEHWYDAYPILHKDAPVYKLEGEGLLLAQMLMSLQSMKTSTR